VIISILYSIFMKPFFLLNNFFITRFFNPSLRTYLFNCDDNKQVILASPTRRQAKRFKSTLRDDNNFFKTLDIALEPVQGNICIDIGANVGYWSMAFNRYLSRDKVIFSIEPERRNLNILSYNLRKEKDISIFQTGLGSKIESKSFGIPEYHKLRGGEHSLNTGNMSIYHSDQKSDRVRLTSVDKLVDGFSSNNDKVFLIKIDVEGYEMDVMLGMQQCIDVHKPVVILEINPDTQKLAKYDLRELLSLLDQYMLFIPVNVDFNIDKNGLPSHSMNMILSPEIIEPDVLELMGYVKCSLLK
jgi:FkbM family methyltransferase